ncbi:MAG: pilus assembly protein PilM [Kiritimatiellales bacterium]|nr:pilus assembly protein PilM [Kiritimatiellales bacterium]
MLFNIHTTGIHYTDEIVEWAVLRKNRTGTEILREGTLPIPEGFFDHDDAPLFPADLLEHCRKTFRGVVTVSLPSSRLLMRVLELPSADPAELDAMVELQADQISPFPADQLTISYEVLHQTEDHSRVLAVAAPRKVVDELGDLFKKKNVYIRSLDAEILVWWSLLTTHREVPTEGRVLIILEEHTEFSIIVVDDGVPVSFRSLELFHNFTDPSVMAEIIEEIRYTLLSLEAEYGHNANARTEIWSQAEFPAELAQMFAELSPAGVTQHDLGTLPPLSEGLALRTADRRRHHTELVPREWVELQRRRQIMKIATVASIAVLCIWMAVVSVTGTVFAFKTASYNRVKKEAARYAGPAREAQSARAEKDSLEKYADRSHSALESLREVTVLLPDDLEINSFDYTKNKAIRLRGSAYDTTPIYTYFQRLGASALFTGIKNERQEKLRQNERSEGFSLTILLPEEATEETP